MPTHKVTTSTSYLIDNIAKITLADTDSQTAGEDTTISESITDGADQLVAFTLDVSQLKAFAIWSTGGNMTVETNNGTTPDDTFSLVDGVAQIWSASQPGSPPNPFTSAVDVTALYVTNTGTATLHIEALFDPTV